MGWAGSYRDLRAFTQIGPHQSEEIFERVPAPAGRGPPRTCAASRLLNPPVLVGQFLRGNWGLKRVITFAAALALWITNVGRCEGGPLNDPVRVVRGI